MDIDPEDFVPKPWYNGSKVNWLIPRQVLSLSIHKSITQKQTQPTWLWQDGSESGVQQRYRGAKKAVKRGCGSGGGGSVGDSSDKCYMHKAVLWGRIVSETIKLCEKTKQKQKIRKQSTEQSGMKKKNAKLNIKDAFSQWSAMCKDNIFFFIKEWT